MEVVDAVLKVYGFDESTGKVGRGRLSCNPLPRHAHNAPHCPPHPHPDHTVQYQHYCSRLGIFETSPIALSTLLRCCHSQLGRPLKWKTDVSGETIMTFTWYKYKAYVAARKQKKGVYRELDIEGEDGSVEKWFIYVPPVYGTTSSDPTWIMREPGLQQPAQQPDQQQQQQQQDNQTNDWGNIESEGDKLPDLFKVWQHTLTGKVGDAPVSYMGSH